MVYVMKKEPIVIDRSKFSTVEVNLRKKLRDFKIADGVSLKLQSTCHGQYVTLKSSAYPGEETNIEEAIKELITKSLETRFADDNIKIDKKINKIANEEKEGYISFDEIFPEQHNIVKAIKKFSKQMGACIGNDVDSKAMHEVARRLINIVHEAVDAALGKSLY